MKPLPKEAIEQSALEVESMSFLQLHELLLRMEAEQPVVLEYIMEVGREVLNQNERERLVFLGLVAWQVMGRDQEMFRVQKIRFGRIEEQNRKMIAYLEGEPEESLYETFQKIMQNANQADFLQYIVDALMNVPEDKSEVREQSKGMMLLFLKTVIEAFDR